MKNIKEYTSGFDVPLFIYKRKIFELDDIKYMEYIIKYSRFEDKLYQIKKHSYFIVFLFLSYFTYISFNYTLLSLLLLTSYFIIRLFTTYKKYIIVDKSFLNLYYNTIIHKYYGRNGTYVFNNNVNNIDDVKKLELISEVEYSNMDKNYYYCNDYYKKNRNRYFIDYVILYWLRVIVKFTLPYNMI